MSAIRQRPKVYVLEPAPHPWAHWGDFGDVLVHGTTSRRASDEIPLRLERTGPFVPPISFPGGAAVVVTDATRAALAEIVRELRFRPVVPARIVRLDWRAWNVAGLEPKVVPPSLEPEDYVRAAPHDPALAESLGPLWEVVADLDHAIEGEDGGFVLDDYQGQPLVRASQWGGPIYVSEDFRAALEQVVPAHVSFRPARLQRRT